MEPIVSVLRIGKDEETDTSLINSQVDYSPHSTKRPGSDVGCTTKFGDALANRRMIALFVSDNVLRACGTSAAVAKEEGLEVWRPRHKRKR